MNSRFDVSLLENMKQPKKFCYFCAYEQVSFPFPYSITKRNMNMHGMKKQQTSDKKRDLWC